MRVETNQPWVNHSSLRYGERGVALPLVIAGLLAILAIAGLALDSSHALTNKTRLQNAVDAAALAAAKEISMTLDTALATVAAMSLLGQNADGAGNHELNDAYDAGEINVIVQYSETSNPFTPGAPQGPYVRVIAQSFDIQTTLSRVLGIDEIPVAASAVAGPSPTVETCEIAPIVVCAENMNAEYFGFVQDELEVLKPEPGNHSEVGPGNYKLLRMPCDDGGGGACVRENMAGAFNQCLSGESPTVETEPGVTAGPSLQGFNTRFGEYSGPIGPEDYPPDVVVTTPSPLLEAEPIPNDPEGDHVILQNGVEYQLGTQINWGFDDYQEESANAASQNPPPTGALGRRILSLPVADCTGDESGQSTLNVEGYACFFMLQPIGGGPDKYIFGQFVNGCLSSGVPGPNPSEAHGPFIIQLYKDPDSGDS